jgi:hypothetical protein
MRNITLRPSDDAWQIIIITCLDICFPYFFILFGILSLIIKAGSVYIWNDILLVVVSGIFKPE